MNSHIKTVTEGLEPYQISFIEGFVICALWSSVTGEDDAPTDEHDADDIARATLRYMVELCTAFLIEAKHLIESDEPILSGDGSDRWAHAGHDYWLTAVGHGAGFLDGDWPINGDKLTALAGDHDWHLIVNATGDIDLY